MAMKSTGKITTSAITNLNTPRGPAIPQSQVGAYQGGLQTDFSGSQTGINNAGDANNYGATSNDSDVLEAQRLTNENFAASHGQNQGVDFNHNNALIDMYKTRIGLKNSLAEQIGAAPGLLNQEQDVNKAVSGQAVGEGLKNTRQNYNSRGLLYSGMREGGEGKVKAAGASQLANAMASTSRESANTLDAAKAAYASVDLASQQDHLDRANQAFDTANANNIARLQAMQQLGSGVGAAAGYAAGSYNSSGSNPTTNWNPEPLQNPGLGSQYTPQQNYGLLGGS